MQLRFSSEFEKSSYLDLIELQDKYGLQDKYNVSIKIMQSTATKKRKTAIKKLKCYFYWQKL